ncbi:MAG: CopG family antitoxin [Caldilineaceae bacterium]
MDGIKECDSIPEFETIEDIADFWDAHSTADYEDVTHEVHFDVLLGLQHKPITLLPELSSRLAAAAQGRGVSVETLVNAWLTEKVLSVGV